MRRAFGIVVQITLLMVVIILLTIYPLYRQMAKSATDVVKDHEKVDLHEETQLQAWQLLQRINMLRQDALRAAGAFTRAANPRPAADVTDVSTPPMEDVLEQALPKELLHRCLRVEIFPARLDGQIPPQVANYCESRCAAEKKDTEFSGAPLLARLRQGGRSLHVLLSPRFYRERVPYTLKDEAVAELAQLLKTGGNPDPFVWPRNYNVFWAGVRCPTSAQRPDEDWILLFALGLDESLRGISGSPRHLGFLYDDSGTLYAHPTRNSELARHGDFDQRIQGSDEIFETQLLKRFEQADRLLVGMDIAQKGDQPSALKNGLSFYFRETVNLDLPDAELKAARRSVQELSANYLEAEWSGAEGAGYRRISAPEPGLPRMRMLAASEEELEHMREQVEDRLKGDTKVNLKKDLKWGIDPIECHQCWASRVQIHLSPSGENARSSSVNENDAAIGMKSLTVIRAVFDEELIADLAAQLSSLKRDAWVVGILAVAITLGLSMLITRPLKKITRAARAIGSAVSNHETDETPELEGFMKKLPIQRPDEIGELSSAFRDVVQQVFQYAARIRERESFLRKIHDTAMDGIVTIDETGRICSFSPAAERMFQRPAGDVIGKHFHMLYPPPVAKELTQRLELYLVTGDSTLAGKRREFVGLRRDGSTFPVELSVSRVENANGRPVFASLLRDVTERKEAETARALSRANEEKTHALREIAHETIGDLTSILGAADQYRRRFGDTLTPKQSELLARIEKSARSLVDFVEDLREIARINEGSTELQLEDFSPADLVEDVLGMLRSKFAEKGHTVRVRLDKAPRSMQGDKSRIRQVIKNLLSNACKYTPHGGDVSVVATCVNDDFRFEVTDTGIGIPDNERDKIFKEFSRASNADSEATGQGLGLALSRRIIEMHWGQIDFKSIVGQGTTFWFQAPLRAWSRPTEDDQAAGVSDVSGIRSWQPFKVLVADSNDSRARELSELLRADGHKVNLAQSGSQMVELVADEKPDLVMTVLNLPGLNAYEAINQIRSSNQRNPPSFILLSRAEPPDVRSHGFSDWMKLPVEKERLRQVLNNLAASAAN
jgi:PAS domain S-box-containing protein